MGSSKRQVVGHHYVYDLQFGLAYALDALLEVRGGGITAWAGRVSSNAEVLVDAPNLWGGEDSGGGPSEGGIVGWMEVAFGDEEQAPNPYLQTHFDQHSALRGKVAALFRDTRYGAYNPYPKPIAFKGERIHAAWPGSGAWYPEKAAIPVDVDLGEPLITSGTFLVQAGAKVGAQSVVYLEVPESFTGTAEEIGQYCVNARVAAGGGEYTYGGSYVYAGISGWDIGAHSVELGNGVGVAAVAVTPVCPSGYTPSFEETGEPTGLGVSDPAVVCTMPALGQVGMNPAHMLYYSKVSPTMEGLPPSALDDENWRAAADVLYSEGFGLCTDWVPGAESVENFQSRICSVIGGALAKSRRDGKWRLRLARGDYVVDELLTLTDADILEWREEPSILDDAVNQLQTKWHDPRLDEDRITPSEHALGAIEAFGGVISQTVSFPEIPSEALALRVNSRELKAKSTPLTRLTLVCSRKAAKLDNGEYFRIQSQKRGLEIVLLSLRVEVGETPTSAVRLSAVEDIYTMPETTYVEPQPPIDYNPPQIPLPVEDQRIFEAPYIELAGTLPAAELAALPATSGFIAITAVRPGSGTNFSMLTGSGGEPLTDNGVGEWCPSAVITTGSQDRDERDFVLSAPSRLGYVSVGTAVLWDEEICRLESLNLDTGEIVLGRGCADTVAAQHAPDGRIYFFSEWAASDQREYAVGETVSAKLLPNTSSAQLSQVFAPTISVLMNERQARPYPPGRIRINGQAWPSMLFGAVEVAGAHRDRLLQADQLVAQEEESIGPEPGTTYSIRWYIDDSLEREQTELAEPADTWTPTASGLVRVEIEAVRDGLASWQSQVREFTWTPDELTSSSITTEAGNPITTESGVQIITEYQ